jgi:hypothetical protein
MSAGNGLIGATSPTSAASKNSRQVISGTQRLREAVLQLAQGAQRELVLLTPTLNRDLYGSDAFCSIVSNLIRSHAQAKMRLLVSSSAGLQAARLLALAHRLPSGIEFRSLADDASARGELLISDGGSFLKRLSAQSIDAEFVWDDAARTQPLREQFEMLWAQGQTHQGTRRLSL